MKEMETSLLNFDNLSELSATKLIFPKPWAKPRAVDYLFPSKFLWMLVTNRTFISYQK